MTIMVQEIPDLIVAVFVALLFGATFIVSLAAWLVTSSRPSLARAILAGCGLAAYFALLLPIDFQGLDRWILRMVLVGYVLPHLLASLDTLLAGVGDD